MINPYNKGIKVGKPIISEKQISEEMNKELEKRENHLNILRKQYIKEFRNNTKSPQIVLRCVRYILKTTEGADIIEHAEKIMRKLNRYEKKK